MKPWQTQTNLSTSTRTQVSVPCLRIENGIILSPPTVQGVISPSGEVSPIPQQPPVPGPKNDDGPQDVYEKPVTSPPPPTIPTPTPPPSAENSGSGAVYARTQIIAGAPPTNDTATEWMYDTTKKDEKKLKPSQLENVLCKGNLEKLGGKNKKTWQVRFCALAGPFMYFYEKESSKTYRNRIVLPMYAVAEAPEHTNAKKRHFAFKLTHTDQGGTRKDYFFRSSKWESCHTWVQAMTSLNERTTITPQHLVVTTPTHPAEGGASGADVQQVSFNFSICHYVVRCEVGNVLSILWGLHTECSVSISKLCSQRA